MLAWRRVKKPPGAVPTYECCKFRGSIVALDAATGKQVWKTYTIAEQAEADEEERRRHAAVGSVGRAGVGDAGRRRQAEVRALRHDGQQLQRPDVGDERFVRRDGPRHGPDPLARQMTAKDAYTAACRLPDKTNCADSNGPDFDFGASPMLVTLPSGRRLLVAGQKSGIVHALDPGQDGEVVWQTRVGRGGTMGGVQWGSATDRHQHLRGQLRHRSHHADLQQQHRCGSPSRAAACSRCG